MKQLILYYIIIYAFFNFGILTALCSESENLPTSEILLEEQFEAGLNIYDDYDDYGDKGVKRVLDENIEYSRNSGSDRSSEYISDETDNVSAMIDTAHKANNYETNSDNTSQKSDDSKAHESAGNRDYRGHANRPLSPIPEVSASSSQVELDWSDPELEGSDDTGCRAVYKARRRTGFRGINIVTNETFRVQVDYGASSTTRRPPTLKKLTMLQYTHAASNLRVFEVSDSTSGLIYYMVCISRTIVQNFLPEDINSVWSKRDSGLFSYFRRQEVAVINEFSPRRLSYVNLNKLQILQATWFNVAEKLGQDTSVNGRAAALALPSSHYFVHSSVHNVPCELITGDVVSCFNLSLLASNVVHSIPFPAFPLEHDAKFNSIKDVKITDEERLLIDNSKDAKDMMKVTPGPGIAYHTLKDKDLIVRTVLDRVGYGRFARNRKGEYIHKPVYRELSSNLD